VSRRRGVGSITSYQTKAGQRWRWQLRVPIDPAAPESGTRLVGRGGYTTARHADDALQDARRRAREVGTARTDAPRLAAYAAQWVEGLTLEASTLAGYRKIIRNHLAPQLGPLPLDKITATRIAAHYRALLAGGRRDKGHEGEPLSANTVHKVHVVLGAILDAAVDDGYLASNQARRSRIVKPPTSKRIRAEAPEVETWTAAQLAAFLAWDRDVYRDDLHMLWLVIAMTGMRRGEALALKWSDVNLDARRISVRRATDYTTAGVVKSTKTGQSRVIDIDDELVAALRKWRTLRGSINLAFAAQTGWVFGDVNGSLYTPKNITARWEVRVKAAQRSEHLRGLPHLSIKGLRHTHATILLEGGTHAKVVQERLGHSNIATTMNIYSHVTPTMQRAAADMFAQALAQGSSGSAVAQVVAWRPDDER